MLNIILIFLKRSRILLFALSLPGFALRSYLRLIYGAPIPDFSLKGLEGSFLILKINQYAEYSVPVFLFACLSIFFYLVIDLIQRRITYVQSDLGYNRKMARKSFFTSTFGHNILDYIMNIFSKHS